MKLNSKNPIIFHFIDNSKRDLYWRLHLAAQLSKQGLTSVIGKSVNLQEWVSSSRNTIILGRLASNEGFSGHGDPILRLLERRNSNIIYFHDEGGFYSRSTYLGSLERSHILRYAYHPKILKIGFWGAFQKRIADKHWPDQRIKYEVVGSPRFDIYHDPYKKVLETVSRKKCQQKERDYILIVTRGSSINPSGINPPALGNRMRELNSYGFKSELEVSAVLFGKWAKQSLDAVMMIKAISSLALHFPNEVFIIRPHPGENALFYSDAFNNYKNVKVEAKGDLGLYLNYAKLVIGNDCTSGFEAMLAGKPFINYRPFRDRLEQYSVYGLSKVGFIVNDEDQLLAEAERSVDSTDYLKIQNKKNKRKQRNIIENIELPSIPRIIELLKSEIGKLKIKRSYVNIKTTTSKGLFRKIRYLLSPRQHDHFKLEFSHQQLGEVWESIKEEKIAFDDAKLILSHDYIVVSAGPSSDG